MPSAADAQEIPGMRYDAIDRELFARNRRRLAALMQPRTLAVVQSNDTLPTNADGTLPFKQNADLLYLTGVDQEETILLVFPQARESKDREILFVKRTNEVIAVWDGEKLSKERATEVSGIERVEWLDAFEGIFQRLASEADGFYLATNEHPRAAALVETRNDRFVKTCRERFPLHRLERLSVLTRRLRARKDPVEVELIRRACGITEAGFRRVLDFIRPDVGEWEIEAEYLHEFVRRRSCGFAYSPIVGSGGNACVLHYLENHSVCGDGDLVLMDIGADWAGWNSDMTRTVPVNGRFGERQRAVYDAVLRVYRGANDLLRPGRTQVDYQRSVVELMEAELVDLGLITAEEAREQGEGKEAVKKYFMHGASHPIGLDVHDVYPPQEPFAPGMVFTIEPGIYICEEKLGIRLENTVLIGEDENINLMASIPIEADEIEELMNRR